MARSVWKGPFVDLYLLKKAETAQESGKSNKPIKTWSRRSTIVPQFFIAGRNSDCFSPSTKYRQRILADILSSLNPYIKPAPGQRRNRAFRQRRTAPRLRQDEAYLTLRAILCLAQPQMLRYRASAEVFGSLGLPYYG